MSIESNFIAFGANCISFPKGSKTSFLYLIERSDNSHGRSICYEYESIIMYYTHNLLQFNNFSGFIHILESISTTYLGGIWAQNCQENHLSCSEFSKEFQKWLEGHNTYMNVKIKLLYHSYTFFEYLGEIGLIWRPRH